MTLNYKDTGGPDEPLIILHGVFGSLSNWNAIAKKLADHFRVFTLDLRNHGRSPWRETMSYPEMAQDIVEFMERLGVDTANIMGHSMGGKVAMALALTHPERARKLIVLDIAPIKYPDRFSGLLAALNKLDLEAVKSRADADKQLAGRVPAQEVRAFLLQNLTKTPDGFRWRINLPVITRSMPEISDFPHFSGHAFDGQTLFVRAGDSDYIQDRNLPEIKQLFPKARLEVIEHASHWLHHEKPEQVTRLIEEFLSVDE